MRALVDQMRGHHAHDAEQRGRHQRHAPAATQRMRPDPRPVVRTEILRTNRPGGRHGNSRLRAMHAAQVENVRSRAPARHERPTTPAVRRRHIRKRMCERNRVMPGDVQHAHGVDDALRDVRRGNPCSCSCPIGSEYRRRTSTRQSDQAQSRAPRRSAQSYRRTRCRRTAGAAWKAKRKARSISDWADFVSIPNESQWFRRPAPSRGMPAP